MSSVAPPPLVLVVDDDDGVRGVVACALTRGGLEVVEAADAEQALKCLGEQRIALVVLDIGLPGMNGLQLLGRLRETGRLPVIMLTGRSSEVDRVIGLEMGADDYVVKPFSPKELCARVLAVLRRVEWPSTAADVGGRLTVDEDRRQVSLDGRVVPLTRREFDLVACLDAHRGQVVLQNDLLARVWGLSDNASVPTVTEHVRRVRLALHDDPRSPRWLRTVRGVGYALDE